MILWRIRSIAQRASPDAQNGADAQDRDTSGQGRGTSGQDRDTSGQDRGTGGQDGGSGAPAAEDRGAGAHIQYWAPDALGWEPLGLDHDGFLTWLLGDAVDEFYAASRWSGWTPHTDRFGPADGVLVDPPLWSQDAEDIDDCTITPAPFEQVIAAAGSGVEVAGGDPYPLTSAQWRAALTRGPSSEPSSRS
ncbi:DUF2625 family protein [Cumulibacter manganitolerans]|uniref:DUF2625 family protein n=1 Tax=Cumulibacter manganitolerans TaxID=1884992 RepID=UPI001294E405|nr:DUF2625 family protein [Cumulibacter manganitolerans]